jgi:hypothetical protein
MSIRRQLRGVLEIITPSGTYYLSPSISERLFLIWIFRNFRLLPFTVLSQTQRRMIESIAAKSRRADPSRCDEILGSMEFVAPAKKPVQSAIVAASRPPVRSTRGAKSRIATISGD